MREKYRLCKTPTPSSGAGRGREEARHYCLIFQSFQVSQYCHMAFGIYPWIFFLTKIRSRGKPSQNAGMSSVGSFDSYVAQKSAVAAAPGNKVTTSQLASINDHYTGPGTQAPESSYDFQEVWHYRKELLPKGVGYLQVDAVFITKKGYGMFVLQRDSDILTTMGAAKKKPE